MRDARREAAFTTSRSISGLGLSFIVRPHTQDANRFLFGKNFVHDAMLNIDAARVCAGKITDQFFKGRWILKWIVGKNREQFLRL
jgi:hypothetical protein